MAEKNLTPRFWRSASAWALLLGVTMLALLFVGRFWWFAEDSSRWAALLRVLLVCGFVASLPGCTRPRADGVGWALFGLFGLYLLGNAIFLAESAHMVRRLLLILIFMLLSMRVLRHPELTRPLLVALALVGGVCAWLSLLVVYGEGGLQFAYRATPLHGSGLGRIAEFGNTIVAGMHYAPSLIAALWLALTEPEGNRQGRRRALWLLAGAGVAIYVYFTYSRTAWLISCGGIAGLLALTASPRARRIALALSLALVTLIGLFGQDALRYEWMDRGVSGRDEIWQVALSRLDGHWIFGYGAGVDTPPIAIHGGAEIIIKHMHSLYVEVLYQFGLIGLTLMLLSSGLVLWRLFCVRRTPTASFWLALFAAGLLGMLFDFESFASSPNAVWLYYWLPLSAAWALWQGKEAPSSQTPGGLRRPQNERDDRQRAAAPL